MKPAVVSRILGMALAIAFPQVLAENRLAVAGAATEDISGVPLQIEVFYINEHGRHLVQSTEKLHAADAIELCVTGPKGHVTVWSFTDTKVLRLWSGPLDPESIGSNAGTRCIGNNGPNKLWIHYGEEDTEFAVFWSQFGQDALGADAFVPTSKSTGIGRPVQMGILRQVSLVRAITDAPREVQP